MNKPQATPTAFRNRAGPVVLALVMLGLSLPLPAQMPDPDSAVAGQADPAEAATVASREDPADGLRSPLTAEERAAAEEAPLELEPLIVGGEQLSFEQELTLRLVRQALDRPRSMERDRFEEWVCWFERPVGTHHHHLSCARNGDLFALQPRRGRPFTAARGEGKYGRVLSTTRPIHRGKLLRLLRDLPGTKEFDTEFVNRARQGERPPRDIPDEEELDRFTAAWTAVGELAAQGAADAALEAAIQAAGLEVDRYNRIAALTERYQSIENEVARRLRPD